MSLYQQIARVGPRYVGKARLFKAGFNLSPMYRRTTARVVGVSEDLMRVRIRVPISWKNKNYVGSIFGGSMFAAVDPIPMVQLINVIGDGYVVWDKAARVRFRAPARQDLYAEFVYTPEQVAAIAARADADGETEVTVTTRLTDRDGSAVFCEVDKTIYVATKAFYKAKKARRVAQAAPA